MACARGNDNGWSGWRNSPSSGPYTPLSPPATPSTVSVTRADGTLTASGYTVSNADTYHITYSSDGGASWSLAALDHAAATITISVDNAKTYIVGVRAKNSAGGSAWRNSASAGPFNPDPTPTPTPAPVQPPATPSTVTVTRADGTLTASGYTVANADSYHITYTSDNAQSWQLAALDHTENTITIDADNAKTYIVGVRAKNDAGGSNWRNSPSAGPYTPIDYDADDDGLIEITTLAQLNAVRWDLDGNGQVTGSNQSNYSSAFPDAAAGATAMGCPSGGCTGYELANDLDFDTNGNDSADSGDTYWNGGAGWTPIGDYFTVFTATFEGNSNKLSNMYINASTTAADITADIGGLFWGIGIGGVVKNLGLEDVSVTVSSTQQKRIFAGALAADNRGTITGAWSSGSVTGSTQRKNGSAWALVGGLVALNNKGGSGNNAYEGVIRASYSTAAATGLVRSSSGDARAGGLVAVNKGTIAASYATGSVNTNTSDTGNSLGNGRVGGLVAINDSGTITASYAKGNVRSFAVKTWDGGLVGRNNNGTITASYSTGTVQASASNKNRGGLVGTNEGSGTVTDSYWNTTTSGKSSSPAGMGKTTSELQTPTGYSGIYANWNVSVDGVTGGDDPWDFGTASQYPILKYGALQNVSQR